MPRVVHTAREKSPMTTASSRLPTPAKAICQAVELKRSAPDSQRLESTDPCAQLNEPRGSVNAAHNSLRPKAPVALRSGHNSTTIPAIPTADLISPRLERRAGPRSSEPRPGNHNSVRDTS